MVYSKVSINNVIRNDWSIRQVDYTNKFARAGLKEEVYIELPKGFVRNDKMDMVF